MNRIFASLLAALALSASLISSANAEFVGYLM